MLVQTLIMSAWMCAFAIGAAVFPARQDRPLQEVPAEQQCPLATVYSYITITETDFPSAVTVAIPDYSSISRSLASVSTIDSLVVVEHSQDRPFNAPPNTVIPTFVHSINAPAVEVTEVPEIGGSVIYLPGTRPVQTVVIGATTESIVLSPFADAAAASTVVLGHASSYAETNFTVPVSGWNATSTGEITFLPTLGTGTAASHVPTSTVTQITYVNTTTAVVNATVTFAPQFSHSGWNTYVRRQTCVLISAQIGAHWASWCNNWDGVTSYSYTSWETTITPGVVHTSSDAPKPTATTLTVQNPPTTITRSVVPVSSGNDPNSAPSTPLPSSGSNSCGEIGAFDIGFDDLPKQSVFENATAALPPIFDPFDHFYWADGWSYLPPPNDPYPPHNGAQLAIFVPPAANNQNSSSDPSFIPIGGFGAGPRSSNDAYWFNMASAWFGCDNNATDPSGVCDFVAEGYRYDSQTNTNMIHTTVHFTQKLCQSSTCSLQQITFSNVFTQLAAISFYAKIGGGVHTFYMDDIQGTWWNDTCEAGRLRASSRR